MNIREIEINPGSIKTLLGVNAKNLIKQFERLNCFEYRCKRMMDLDCSLAHQIQTSHAAGMGAWGKGQSNTATTVVVATWGFSEGQWRLKSLTGDDER